MEVVFLEITRLRSINRGVSRGLRGRLQTLLTREFFSSLLRLGFILVQ